MLLQNFDDVERLARALQQQEKGALEAAAAAQLRYVALREQMAAREQELVDEMLRKANAEHSDAAAAQTQLEQELQAQKLELKALEERDREEAKEKGLGKVVRSTKDAYWEEERAARDLEQKQSEIAAANKELQELQQKQAQLIASNEEELRAERQRAEASQRARLEKEMEREFQQRQASLQLQLATKETLQNALSPRTKVMQRRGTEASATSKTKSNSEPTSSPASRKMFRAGPEKRLPQRRRRRGPQQSPSETALPTRPRRRWTRKRPRRRSARRVPMPCVKPRRHTI
jgi:hypothetical protein